MPLATTLIYALIVLGSVLAFLIILFSIRRREREEEFSEIGNLEMNSTDMPFTIEKTVPSGKAGRAQKELRLLGLEREILSDAIRRLYEAHAEGKITEEEREKIARNYKSRIRRVKERISEDESLLALHELETMQEDLLKLFSDRFEELTGKIEGLRSQLEVEPVKEIPVPTAQKPKEKKAPKKKKKPRKTRSKTRKKKPKEEKEEDESRPKTEAEKKVDQIREEVEKVLDRLGQMEVET